MPLQPTAVRSTTQPWTTTFELRVIVAPDTGVSMKPANVSSPTAFWPAIHGEPASAAASVSTWTIVARATHTASTRRLAGLLMGLKPILTCGQATAPESEHTRPHRRRGSTQGHCAEPYLMR